MRFLTEAGGPPGGEGEQGVADGLGGAAEAGADLGGLEPPGAGQEDLAAPQGEGQRRTQAGPEGLGFLGG